MSAPVYYSAPMVRAMPDDGNRYETVHGELLVTPAPQPLHQRVLQRMYYAVESYLRVEMVGEAFLSPADISWGPDILVQPDLFVVDHAQGGTLDWSRVTDLLLAVEVISPSTARHDRFTKRRLYQEVGVPVYWIVDPEGRYVEVWTPDATYPVVERRQLVWAPRRASEPLRIFLPEVFTVGRGSAGSENG